MYNDKKNSDQGYRNNKISTLLITPGNPMHRSDKFLFKIPLSIHFICNRKDSHAKTVIIVQSIQYPVNSRRQ